MKPPKRKSDWAGNYVRSRIELGNRLGNLPAGTIFKVRRNCVIMELESAPCSCCGFKLRVSLQGRDKEALFDFLGPTVVACENTQSFS